jgi:hypothetical protein
VLEAREDNESLGSCGLVCHAVRLHSASEDRLGHGDQALPHNDGYEHRSLSIAFRRDSSEEERRQRAAGISCLTGSPLT